jgi:phenylacetate-CoA ligase
MFVPDIELESAEEISQFQLVKLQEQLQYLKENSPYYMRFFKQHGINVNAVKSFSDFAKIPFTSKETFHTHNDEFLCVEKGDVAEYTSTSGTTGKPVTIALTEDDLDRLAYNEFISFCCADGTDEDVYQLMLTLDKQFMAGMAYYAGIRELGATVIRTGPGAPQFQIESIQRYGTTVLVGVPSFLLKLIEYAEANGIDLNTLSVKKVVCIGESVRGLDLQPNVLHQKISAKWNVQLYSTYASTEMQTAFTECGYGCGGHQHPELIYAEIIGENGQQVAPGEFGEVVITTLNVEAMPLLRYQTGDICSYYTEPCECGRNTIRLSPVAGRKNQLIKFKGTTLYPTSVFNVLNEIKEIEDYILEVTTNDTGTDELIVHLILRDSQPGVKESIAHAFQSALRVLPQIVVSDSNGFAAMRKPDVNRKLVRFVDSRSKA